jgi:hypothetical protein
MKECYVCNRMTFTSEMDHFPIPARMGGETTFPICRDCHDLKDRHPLGTWNPDLAFSSLASLWGKATAEERLWLVKVFHILSDEITKREGRS